MLHLTSLLDSLPPPSSAGQLRQSFQDYAGDAFEAGPSSASSSTNLWPPLRGAGAGTSQQAQQAQRHHPYPEDPGTLATLLAFRRTLGSAAGIVVDSAPSQPTAAIWSRWGAKLTCFETFWCTLKLAC